MESDRIFTAGIKVFADSLDCKKELQVDEKIYAWRKYLGRKVSFGQFIWLKEKYNLEGIKIEFEAEDSSFKSNSLKLNSKL